jgi:hypothetical protein
MYHTSEVPLKLDEYNDIFSDFDARPFHQRALSQDFLSETKRASVDKAHDYIELKLLVPSNKRNLEHEEIIKKRLKAHFKRHFSILNEEKKKIIERGAVYVLIGLIMMVAATIITIMFDEDRFLIAFLIILLDPAGWFFLWEGMGLIIFESKKKNQDHDFYEKMSKSKIYFLRY